MSRLNAPLLLLILGVASTACSAITDFDRGKIVRGPVGMVTGDGSTDGDDAGPDEMDGDVVDPGGCEPGTAGEACEPCVPGEYCAGGSAPAIDCPESEWDHDLNPATSCVLQRDCSPGEFVSAMGTTTSDRVCAPCASGRFSGQPNSPLCDGWTTCEVGEYVKQAGTTGSDQLCEACAEGEYSDAPNSGRCVPIGECAAGSKKAPSGQPGQCLACSIGEYCAGGDEPPVVCAEGTWDHDASPASPCVEWTACGPGMAMSMAGSSTGNRVCTDCPSGTFSASPNATMCTPWSDCGAGTFVSMTGGPAADRVCSPCAEGTFTAAPNATACAPHATCGAGTFVGAAGTASTDRVCTPCPAGQFNTADNAQACTPWTTCRPGAYVSRTGTASRNQMCTDCGPGLYSAVENAGECSPRGSCAAGQRQVRPGSATMPPTCAACDPGQYCAGGSTPPVSCGDGTWDHDRNPGTQCAAWTACDPGGYVVARGSATADRACRQCEPGTFSTAMNAAECEPWSDCEPGSSASGGSARSDRVCTTCGDGTFTSGMNEPVCRPHRVCGAGQHVTTPAASSTNNRSCADCPSGTFSTSMNVEMCSPWRICQPGSRVVSEGERSADRECTPCPTGTTSTGANARQCFDINQCQAGTRQTRAPTDAMPMAGCAPCAPGEYCPGGTNPGGPCPNEQWDHDRDPGSQCRAWSNCAAGSYSPAVPSTTVDRDCRLCTSGYTTAETANTLRECTPWSACSGDQYIVERPTTGPSVCAPRRVCQPGSYQVEESPLPPDAPRTCMACALGTVSNSSNAAQCTQCSAGTFPDMGSTVCTNCVPGYFNPDDGGTDCREHTSCDATTHVQIEPGNSVRNPICHCRPGYFVRMQSSVHPICEPCQSGSFSSGTNAMACTPLTMCGPGQRLATEGNATRNNECAPCPVGTANLDAVNAAMCTPCTGETYSPNVGATACTPWTICNTSQYVATNGTASTNRTCEACPNGGTTPAPNSPMSACTAPPPPDAGM